MLADGLEPDRGHDPGITDLIQTVLVQEILTKKQMFDFDHNAFPIALRIIIDGIDSGDRPCAEIIKKYHNHHKCEQGKTVKLPMRKLTQIRNSENKYFDAAFTCTKRSQKNVKGGSNVKHKRSELWYSKEHQVYQWRTPSTCCPARQ